MCLISCLSLSLGVTISLYRALKTGCVLNSCDWEYHKLFILYLLVRRQTGIKLGIKEIGREIGRDQVVWAELNWIKMRMPYFPPAHLNCKKLKNIKVNSSKHNWTFKINWQTIWSMIMAILFAPQVVWEKKAVGEIGGQRCMYETCNADSRYSDWG